MNQEELPKQMLGRLLHVGQLLASAEDAEVVPKNNPTLPESDPANEEDPSATSRQKTQLLKMGL